MSGRADDDGNRQRARGSGRRSKRSANATARGWLGWTLAAIIVLSPLALGAVTTTAALVLSGLGLALWAAALWAPGRQRSKAPLRLGFTPLALFFWLLALVATLQLVPMPPGLFEVLSPQGARLFDEGHALLCEGDLPWRPLSLHAAGTADFGLHMLALALMTALASSLPAARWRQLAMAAGAAAILVVLVGLAQRITGAEGVLWIHVPPQGLRTLSTFVSENHAAAHAAMGSLVAMILAVGHGWRHDRRQASAAAVAALLLFAAALSQPSVGTMLAYVLALGTLGVLVVVQRRLMSSRRSGGQRVQQVMWLALTLTAVAVIVALLLPLLASELALEQASIRLNLIEAALEASGAYGVVGAGLGSSGEVLLSWIDWKTTTPGRPTAVENDLVELTFTAGWPVTLAAVAAWALTTWSALRLAMRRHRPAKLMRRLGVASLVVLLLVLAQFHFPFHALGLAIPMVVLIELGLVSETRREDGRESRVRWVLPVDGRRPQLALWGAALIMGAALSWSAYHHPDPAARDWFDEPTQDASRAQLCEMVVSSPASVTPFVLAVSRLEAPPEQRLAWAKQAHELAPLGRYRLFLAQFQMRAGAQEAGLASFASLFDESYLERPQRSWILAAMAATPGAQDHRARMLDHAAPEWWERFYRQIAESEGPVAAMDFALALSARHDTAELDNLLMTAFQQARQHELAELWARQLWSRTRDPERRAIAEDALFASLWHQQRRREALEVLDRGYKRRGGPTIRLAQRTLELLAFPPREASEAYVAHVEAALGRYCARPLVPERRRLCWRAEAWLAEQRGDLSKARVVLRRLQRRHGEEAPLRAFLVRQGRCRELERWRLQDNSPTSPEEKQAWETARQQCEAGEQGR